MDILSLVPLDLLYYKYGVQAVYLRAPRLLKVQSFWELFRLLDRVIASPYFVSVFAVRNSIEDKSQYIFLIQFLPFLPFICALRFVLAEH